MLLAAFEASLRQSAKDESAWQRMYAELAAEPREERAARRAAVTRAPASPGSGRMGVSDAEAMLARFAASDAQYGR